jgi:flavin-dependent dehydrogenase
MVGGLYLRYDLVVVGGGPAGLMTAKTAAERNLEVVLVDDKKEISQINRPCGMMLHMAPGLHNITLRVEPGKLVYHEPKFSVNYTGDLYDLYYQIFFSRSGYKYCTVNKNPCLGKVIDKEELLRGLSEEARKLGVDIRSETMGLKAENTSDGVKIQVRSRGQLASIEAKVGVAADGVNSSITESLGLNEKRQYLGKMGPFMGYVVEGVECPYENAYLFYRASTYSPTVVVNTIPRASGNNVWLILPRTEEGLKYFLTKGRVADWFKNAKVIFKAGYHNEMYTPIMEPVAGNVLIVGDAAGTYEVEVHGALACGYEAGVAAARAVREDKEKGLKAYVDWWQNSIEYVRNPSVINVFKKAAVESFDKYFTEDEIDYIFSLINNEMFPGVMNPFTMFDKTADAFFKHADKIRKERPSLLKKIEKWIGMSSREFKASRSAFTYPIIR